MRMRQDNIFKLFTLKKTINCIAVKRLLSSDVRVRFAPSPTGFLHLGSIRTALYNFLFAKKHKGSFILRIEDTDQERVVPGAIQGIEKELKWMSLHPDEGPSVEGHYGPYIQSQRKHLYQEKINELLESGHGYRCFCSQTRLDLLRKEALKNREIPKYDSRCRELSRKEIDDKLSRKEPFTVRLKLTVGNISWQDLVAGHVTIDLSRVEGDPIMFKSDGFPTYHFANVIDDHAMKVSHVLRGNEWLNSTPKHLMLFDAFGWTPPKYAHLPLILNADGTKLSKRTDDIRLEQMRIKGFFPETILNSLAKISGGINFDSDQTVLSLGELIGRFNPEGISSSSNRFDAELMKALNRKTLVQFLEQKSDDLVLEVKRLLGEKYGGEVANNADPKETKSFISWNQNRIHFLPELIEDHGYLWKKPDLSFDSTDFENSLGCLQSLLLKVIETLKQNSMDTSCLKTFCKENNLKFGIFMHFLRCCLTNKSEGPPIKDILSIMGQESFIENLNRAAVHFSKKKHL